VCGYVRFYGVLDAGNNYAAGMSQQDIERLLVGSGLVGESLWTLARPYVEFPSAP
jgi:hypothetical protein